MASVLADSYNLAMMRLKTMKGTMNPLSPVNNNNQNNQVNQNNQTDSSAEFKDKLDAIANKTDIKYTDGGSISYSGKVKALSDPKIQKKIKDLGIDKAVTQASQKYNIPENLIYKIIETESYFNNTCVSSAGAMGLMQLMPVNCKEDGVSDPYDPYQNIMAGTKQLRRHLDSFNGDLKLALAAYNAGPGNVRKYGGVPPFRETQNYIRKILGVEP